jgi:hypothetical protein
MIRIIITPEEITALEIAHGDESIEGNIWYIDKIKNIIDRYYAVKRVTEDRYTEKNLRTALRKIDPKQFDIWQDRAKVDLPKIIDEMFSLGFFKYLKNTLTISSFFEVSEIKILIRAYEDLNEHPGYLQFELGEE